MKKLMIILMMCLVSFSYATEQKFATAYIHSYPRTIGKGMATPLHWETTDWLQAAGIAGIGTALYCYDEDINHWIQANQSDFTKDVCYVGKQFGDGKYIIPALGVTVLGGYLFDSPQTTDTGLLCLKSFLLANGVTTSLKFLTQRQRPYRDNGNQFWNGKGFKLNRDSFPSGHATVVWSVAPVLAAQYKEQIWVAPLVYGVAGLTSYSRMHDNKHWASDVFAGAVIGYITSELTLKSTPRLQVMPGSKGQYLSISWDLDTR